MVTCAQTPWLGGGGTLVSPQLLIYDCTTLTSTFTNTVSVNSTAWVTNGFVEETEAERLAREERHAKERRERKEALERSRVLLLRHLSDRQRDTFEAKKYFDIKSQDHNKYRIDSEQLHKIGRFDANGSKIIGSLCVYHSGVPEFDDLLGIKLGFEYDESETVRIANKHPAWRRSNIQPWAAP